MKDFRLERKANPKYILNVEPVTGPATESGEPEELLEVTFADGRVFRNIRSTDENIATIVAQQEKQAQEGVENLSVFKRRKTLSGVMSAASVVGGPFIVKAVTSLCEGAQQAESDPLTFAISAGVVTLAALIPSLCSLVKNAGKVKELNKIKYRTEHREELTTYTEYENSLVGLSPRKQEWFESAVEQGFDPFCITEIDSYSEADLRQIMDNIETEKTYQFTYQAKPKTTAKNN